MKHLKTVIFATSLVLLSPLAAYAQSGNEATVSQSMSTGVVKKINTEQGKITISHGPLTNLDMPAMTMVFRVADPEMLVAIKIGDSIKFKAEKVNGALTVVKLERAS